MELPGKKARQVGILFKRKTPIEDENKP